MTPLPKRISPRLTEYDYSTSGAYFVTLCTHKRRKLFCRIVGALHEAPAVQLTRYGRVAERVIGELSQRFPVTVANYVVMPDHIHLLVLVDTERALREAPLHSRSLLSKMMGYFKMNVSKEIHHLGFSEQVWQRSFYDHIVRNEQDYLEIWQYIDNNPRAWWLKQENI